MENKMKPHVNVKGEWICADLVKFLDVEEDMQGYDLVTFEYDGKQYQSYITLRPI